MCEGVVCEICLLQSYQCPNGYWQKKKHFRTAVFNKPLNTCNSYSSNKNIHFCGERTILFYNDQKSQICTDCNIKICEAVTDALDTLFSTWQTMDDQLLLL